ncbi:MAG: class I tRNA ligase family protein, partial [Thiotrichales bacterium]|nr:class I tRNA ligase family protein [Thiotrichales bacterium]MBT7438944.1 class I tRNA ligase family protein [Thiotrichales bacterium]
LHPIIPFITEEIFEQSQKLQSKSTGKLISQPFPELVKELQNADAETEINWLKQFILGIRKIRGEMNISPGKPLPCFIKSYSKKDQSYIENNKAMLFTLAKLDTVDLLSVDDEEPESAIALVGKMKILIPLAGLIDKGAERERLNKEIEKLVKLKSQFSAKLNNEKFINGAPKAVVKNEKEKLASAESALKDLEQQLEKISKL